jgi:hypothetical protein
LRKLIFAEEAEMPVDVETRITIARPRAEVAPYRAAHA